MYLSRLWTKFLIRASISLWVMAEWKRIKLSCFFHRAWLRIPSSFAWTATIRRLWSMADGYLVWWKVEMRMDMTAMELPEGSSFLYFPWSFLSIFSIGFFFLELFFCFSLKIPASAFAFSIFFLTKLSLSDDQLRHLLFLFSFLL